MIKIARRSLNSFDPCLFKPFLFSSDNSKTIEFQSMSNQLLRDVNEIRGRFPSIIHFYRPRPFIFTSQFASVYRQISDWSRTETLYRMVRTLGQQMVFKIKTKFDGRFL